MSELKLNLPKEYLDLCDRDGVDPEIVIRGFIADLTRITNWVNPNPSEGRHHRPDDGYYTNGSDERRLAYEYYERCGYPFPELSKGKIRK